MEEFSWTKLIRWDLKIKWYSHLLVYSDMICPCWCKKWKKKQGYVSIWRQFVQMYNWAEAISHPVINSEPPAFSYFKVCSPPVKSRNQIRISLKDIRLRILNRKNITGNSLDIRLYQICQNLNSWTLIFNFNINHLVFKFP